MRVWGWIRWVYFWGVEDRMVYWVK
jgi:hypothetical protein